MKGKVNQKLKKIVSGFVAVATAITMLPQMPAFAETGTTTFLTTDMMWNTPL